MPDSMKILFVDDEPLDVLFARQQLKSDGLEFTSRAAVDLEQLRALLRSFAPDVVLCDYTMPGMSCWEALQSVQELRPETPVVIVSGSIADDVAKECLTRGATDYLLKSNLRRLGPAVQRAVAHARERRVMAARIDELRYRDELTGLHNIAFLNAFGQQSLERSRGVPAAIIAIHVDRLEHVDDYRGHAVADESLRDIARTLRQHTHEPSVAARVGASDFLLICTHVGSAIGAETHARRVVRALSRTRLYAGHDIRIQSSAGVALYPADGSEFEDLWRKARIALGRAKQQPDSVLCHSDDELEETLERYRIEVELADAIEREELNVYFQPQYDLSGGTMCGIEALARWIRPDGAVPPSVFVPIAESNGMIRALGRWVLHGACGTAGSWLKEGLTPPHVAVNVSAHQISESFAEDIVAALEASALPARLLELEITESALVNNLERASRCLEQWKTLGVQIALDDFGTGYSSLNYLAKLPVDRLKIDASLIHAMTASERENIIVRGVISLGRELGISVLAEGVETAEQMALLQRYGCDQAQGYLLTRPCSAADTRALITARSSHTPPTVTTAH